VAAGFEATLLRHATRAVNLQPTDGEEALATLAEAGVDLD
jgi:hypothetical protein